MRRKSGHHDGMNRWPRPRIDDAGSAIVTFGKIECTCLYM